MVGHRSAYAALNRRELPPTTPDWASVDHRRTTISRPVTLIAYIRLLWDDTRDTKIDIAAVHRLSNLGAVVTHAAHGELATGLRREWREIHVLTVEGDLLSRCEMFDEATSTPRARGSTNSNRSRRGWKTRQAK